MKRIHLVIAVIVLGVIAGSTSLLWQHQNLQTQLLSQSLRADEIRNPDDCLKLAEISANDCFERLAIERRDADLCDDISKPTRVSRCQREVELAQ